MAKGDDAILRKKNKAVRKKQQKDSSNSVSARVAAIIAAKKRRQTGQRRQCQVSVFLSRLAFKRCVFVRIDRIVNVKIESLDWNVVFQMKELLGLVLYLFLFVGLLKGDVFVVKLKFLFRGG